MNPLHYRKFIIFAYVTLFLLSIIFILRLKVHYHFENFFPADDPAYLTYKDFRQKFPVDDRMLILAVKADNEVFDTAFIKKAALLEESIGRIAHVSQTNSLATMRIPVKTPLGFIQNPVLSTNPARLKEDAETLSKNPAIKGYYLSEDLSHYAIYIALEDSTSDKQNRHIIKNIQKTVVEAGFQQYHMAGFLYTQVSYILLLEREIPFTSLYVAFGLSLILLLLYRSIKNTIQLTFIVLVGLVIFFGYLGLVGRTLNITSTLFITIMIIVGISDIIHLQTYYHKFLSKGVDRLQSIVKAYQEVKLNLFLTSVTTAAGFLTFLNSSIPHISTFGLDAAIGVLIAFILSITLAPVIFYYFPPDDSFLFRLSKQKKWDRFLFGLYKNGKKNTKTVLGISLIVSIMALVLIPGMNSNQTLAGNFSPKHQIKQDIDFFEAQFGGIRGFEIAISPKSEYKITDKEVLLSIDAVEQKLKNSGNFGVIFSPASYTRFSNQINTAFREGSDKIPDDQEYIEYLLVSDVSGRKNQFINEEANAGRLVSKMRDVGTEKAEAIKYEFIEWLKNSPHASVIDIEITGSAVLIDANNKSVNNEMFVSLAIAFCFISFLMAILFKNIPMVLVSIIPNIVPLIAVGGMMSLSGIPLNAATSLIFTIGFVIAIDDTIHFLTRFRTEIKLHNNLEMAIQKTIQYTGKAVTHTTLILLVGYGTLIMSSFKEIYHHAILVAATLIFAWLSDLYLLPAILRILWKRK